jgi:hypothetical protein
VPALDLVLGVARAVGPKAALTLKKAGPRLVGDPELRQELATLAGAVQRAAKRRTRAQRLGAMLAAIEDQAASMAATAESATEKARATGWADRAVVLLGMLDLIAVRRGRDRRADLHRLQDEVDQLYADVFGAVVGGRGEPADEPAGQSGGSGTGSNGVGT